MRHGVMVVGITVATMRSVDQMAARVGGTMKGARSSCVRLTLTAYNPGHQIFLDPIMKWAKGIWDRALPDTVLLQAWKHAVQTAILRRCWQPVARLGVPWCAGASGLDVP